jgi:hypothetical protein
MYNENMTNIFKIFSPHQAFATSDWTGVSDGVATIGGAEDLYRNILQAIMGLAGLVFFAMLIVGGFKYLTSGGDPKKAASASSTLTTSVIGIVGVIASWLILKFITDFTGIDVTKFDVSVN